MVFESFVRQQHSNRLLFKWELTCGPTPILRHWSQLDDFTWLDSTWALFPLFPSLEKATNEKRNLSARPSRRRTRKNESSNASNCSPFQPFFFLFILFFICWAGGGFAINRTNERENNIFITEETTREQIDFIQSINQFKSFTRFFNLTPSPSLIHLSTIASNRMMTMRRNKNAK